jgi:hypothetical protein
MRFRNEKIRFGVAAESEYQRLVVTEEHVRKLVTKVGEL